LQRLSVRVESGHLTEVELSDAWLDLRQIPDHEPDDLAGPDVEDRSLSVSARTRLAYVEKYVSGYP